jgi:hypothetical protein
MKKSTKSNHVLFLLLTCLIFSFSAYSQTAPSWVWAKSAGGGADDQQSYAVATDGLGNIYVAGSFTGNSMTIGTFTLTNPAPASYNVFIAKYNNVGNVMWARTFGSTDDNVEAYGIEADGSGNVYVTGYFQSSSLLIGTTLPLVNSGGADGSADIFVVKYSSVGTEQWAKKAGTAGNDEFGYSLGRDNAGNIYITGLSMALL